MKERCNAADFRRFVKGVILFGLFSCFLLLSVRSADAKTLLMSKTDMVIGKEDEKTFDIMIEKPQYIQILIDMEWVTHNDENTHECELLDAQGRNWIKDYNCYYYDHIKEHTKGFYSTRSIVNPGTYTIEFVNDGGWADYSFSVYGFDNVTNSLKWTGRKKVKGGTTFKIATLKGTDTLMPAVLSVKSSNNKVMDCEIWQIDLKGNIEVYPEGPGKATVTIKLLNGKTFRKTITVTPPDPNFEAYIDSYNTRNNYMTVIIRNCGPGKLTVKPGAKLINLDHKVYDRSLRNGSVTIKPYKSQKIRFYINGSETYPEIERFRIDYQFSYYNKTYSGRILSYDSTYKKGKKWVESYSDN